MYSDNTLTPKETIRFCALGLLTNGASSYSDLAIAVRHFVDRIQGPSLDVLGTSIELLKYEGLVEPVEGLGMEDDAVLALTDAGMVELKTLMTSRIRAQGGEVNKLITTLKLRFLHILGVAEQARQADLLIEGVDTELARLDDLRQSHANDAGHLTAWLDHDIAQLENHLGWLENLREKICAG